MYSRYTSFEFEVDDRPAVESFWRDVGGPVAASQPGFRGGLILESVQKRGVIRAVTLWDNETDFEAFSAGADHGRVTAGIQATTMATTERDGLKTMGVLWPTPGEVRIIRCSIRPGQLESLRRYWPTNGRATIEGASGCIKAEAFVDPDQMIFILMVYWRSSEDAEAFRLSAAHNEEFAPAIERYVTRLDRLRTLSLNQEVTQ
jgi:heme-degrading monooxygenase HmoA